MVTESSGPTYREIASFFLPLSVTNLMLNLSHSVVNAGVARTGNPEIALAAYALARSLVRLIENPVMMVRQTVASLVTDKDSFFKVRRFIYVLTFIVSAIIAILGFTPLGYYVFRHIMGASDEVATQSHLALSILFLLPFAAVTRNLYHGVAILRRQTMMVPKSSFLRLVIMSMAIFSLALYTELPGALSASISFVSAFIIEALVMRWRAKPLLADTTVFSVSTNQASLSYRGIGYFFLPLLVTTFVATAFGPLINSGLARSINPITALAAFSVGNALGQLFVAPLNMLHQCTLAFTRVGVPQTYTVVKQFVFWFSLGASSILLLISFSPIAVLLLEHVIGVSGEVAASARLVMQVKILLPLVLGWREYLWGIFMQQRLTKIIGSGKAVNLVALIVVLGVLIGTRTGNPAAAGAWALVFGELAECVYMQIRFQRTSVYQESQEVSL